MKQVWEETNHTGTGKPHPRIARGARILLSVRSCFCRRTLAVRLLPALPPRSRAGANQPRSPKTRTRLQPLHGTARLDPQPLPYEPNAAAAVRAPRARSCGNPPSIFAGKKKSICNDWNLNICLFLELLHQLCGSTETIQQGRGNRPNHSK